MAEALVHETPVHEMLVHGTLHKKELVVVPNVVRLTPRCPQSFAKAVRRG